MVVERAGVVVGGGGFRSWTYNRIEFNALPSNETTTKQTRSTITLAHPPMVLPTAAQARPPPAARSSPPSPGMPRNPSYCTPWPSPRLFYHPVTEEGRGRWGRRVTYEKRGRGGWGEEEVVAVLTKRKVKF